jgi:NAD(P)-dependent dehydrogenase (short-subunit alcohol dehydrogenase family)
MVRGFLLRPAPGGVASLTRGFASNLTSAFLCSQAVHPAMKAAGGGKIINTGSMMSTFDASFAPACAARRHRAVHPDLRLCLGRRQLPGQRRAAGLDRYDGRYSVIG